MKAMSYMLGARAKLPKIDESNGYDAAWLGLVLPSGREVTLYRSTKGGGIRLHDGLVTSGREKHRYRTRDPPRTKGTRRFRTSCSTRSALADKMIVRNANADKDKLSIRLLAPLFLIEEDLIISGRSPILYSQQHTEVTFEKNLFRLLLTGQGRLRRPDGDVEKRSHGGHERQGGNPQRADRTDRRATGRRRD